MVRSIEIGREYVLSLTFIPSDPALSAKPWEIRGPNWQRDFHMAKKWRVQQGGTFLDGKKVERVVFYYAKWDGSHSHACCTESEPVALSGREVRYLNGDTADGR